MIKKLMELLEMFFAPTMKLELTRSIFTPKSTIGELTIDGTFECYTLEDEDKLRQGKPKVYGVTAIPSGTYVVDITHSPKYNKPMPLLRDVEGFRGIRIHSGNVAKDTEGCILVGCSKRTNSIGKSRLAYKSLFGKLQEARKAGRKITMRIG